jgi:hypothetical protein
MISGSSGFLYFYRFNPSTTAGSSFAGFLLGSFRKEQSRLLAFRFHTASEDQSVALILATLSPEILLRDRYMSSLSLAVGFRSSLQILCLPEIHQRFLADVESWPLPLNVVLSFLP